jgi:hypothetical protein
MEKELFKSVYREPRTLLRYDARHAIVYPDETIINDYKPDSGGVEEQEPFKGYQYEGTERDGGYIVECVDVNDIHEVANAIIRTHYSLSEEIALQRHYQEDAVNYEERWKAYCLFADSSVEKAKNWLGIKD